MCSDLHVTLLTKTYDVLKFVCYINYCLILLGACYLFLNVYSTWSINHFDVKVLFNTHGTLHRAENLFVADNTIRIL